MSFAVPANQSVSFAIYWPSVIREAGVSVEDARAHQSAIVKGFDVGEPIWMAALTLKTLVECNRGYRKEKTPLALARRVVRM